MKKNVTKESDNASFLYEYITSSVLKNALDKAEWIKAEDYADYGEYNWVLACYTRQNAIASGTDYKSHKKDTIETIKKRVYDSIENRIACQNISYYNHDNKIFDTVVIYLYSDGWSTKAQWKDGSLPACDPKPKLTKHQKIKKSIWDLI